MKTDWTDFLAKPERTADTAVAAEPVAEPENLDASFTKLGGKVVRPASPTAADEPDPDAFAEHGGKFVGRIPTADKADKG